MNKFIAIDADSINTNLRKIIIKSCARTSLKTIFVADRELKDVTLSKAAGVNVDMIIVKTNQDSADDWIVENYENLYFCISHDVGLAVRLAEKNIKTLDKWGKITTFENANEKKSLREINAYLREDGVFEKKTRPIGKKETEAFANALEKLIRETQEV